MKHADSLAVICGRHFQYNLPFNNKCMYNFLVRIYFVRILRVKFSVTRDGGELRWGLIAGVGGYRTTHTVFIFVSYLQIHSLSMFPLILINDHLNPCGHSRNLRA